MKSIQLHAHYEAWLQAARFHLNQGTPPERFEWSGEEETGTFFGESAPSPAGNLFPISLSLAPRIRLPEAFEKRARLAALHRSSHRWRALYRVAWRLVHGESRLMERRTDPEVHELETLAAEVETEWRRLPGQAKWTYVRHAGRNHRVAWLEPRHHTLAAAAPAWVRQLGSAPWTVLSSEHCIHWDGHNLFETNGVEPASSHPSPEEVEAMWRAHCKASFTRAPALVA